MMKILQVIDTLNVGGAERVFVDICNILKENHQNVSALILLNNSGVLADNLNVPIIELNRKNKWNFFTMYKCSLILKKYDIVHCHLRQVYKYIALIKLIFNLKTKIVFHDHYGSINNDKSVPFLFNSIFKPKFYIGVSNILCDWAKNKLQMADDKVFLLDNIIRKRFQTTEINKKYDFILVSNIKPIKNNLFAIELCKLVNKSLLLVGKNQNNPYYLDVVKNVEKLNDGEINTTVSEAQLIIPSARIGLHTSKSETGPLVLIEFLAQGIPFLAYETGEVAKILKPYFPEFFINNFDLKNWESKINTILNMDIDKTKMDFVFNKYFSEKNYYEKLMIIYLCVLKN